MIEFRGQAVSAGIAVGPAVVLKCAAVLPRTAAPLDLAAELQRLEAGISRAQAQLEALREKAAGEVGADAAEIFEVQRMMLDDPDYREALRGLVGESGQSAEAAVRQVGEKFAQTFAASGDDCLKARAADVRDVSNLLVSFLAGREPMISVTEPSVLVADEIVPSALLGIDRQKLLAIVSRKGSVISHASILARQLGLPAVVNAAFDLDQVCPGVRTLVDGSEGRVIFGVDAQTASALAAKVGARPADQRAALVERYAGKIELGANISGPDDLAEGLPPFFAGVGLFRTEFLYLARPDLPGEEEQYRAYCQTIERAGGRKVVVRTFDLGADKQAEALGCAPEANPALGCRGIRLSLRYPEVFKVQLRALLRAAAVGDLRILYPMITSVEEVVRAKALVQEVAVELERAGIPHRVSRQGVMIETPAAALISEELAKIADFFSIGTNDLTQYTLAADREGAAAGARSCHPAVMKLIRLTAENAHRAGIPVSICGELAADSALAEFFIEMKIDALSLGWSGFGQGSGNAQLESGCDD